MSGTSDKARFYLEQAVPQLREFEEKKIFTKEEIKSLVKKRSDFEHTILSRGTQPLDFARYAAWETSLEQLRLRRCRRLRIKGSTTHSGQARIFSIFDRGTRKHAGDVGLWMSYMETARRAGATRKFKTVMTAAIRLHPTRAALWLYAARWALEGEADVNGARSYLQRGTRFCVVSAELWVEYARLEMIYLAKIALRRKILGLDVDRTLVLPEGQEKVEEGEEAGGDFFDSSKDMIAFPDFKTHTIRPAMIAGVEVDSEAAKDPMTTPALNGAIPLAIFDAARKQPFFCAAAAEEFFNTFAEFTQLRCLPKILQHVLACMTELYATDPCTCNCYIRQPLAGIDSLSAEFPAALGSSLDRITESMERTKDRATLVKKTRAWMEPILELQDLDTGIQTVLQHSIRKLM